VSCYRIEDSLEEAALLPFASAAAALAEQLEGALARLVALAGQVLQGLAAGGLLAAADDATVLVLHQLRFGEPTGGVLGGAVVDLGLGANRDGGSHLILWGAILSRSGCARAILSAVSDTLPQKLDTGSATQP